MAQKDDDETGQRRFVIDYEVKFDSPPDEQRKTVTAADHAYRGETMSSSVRARAAMAAVRLATAAELAFNPNQKRDARGRWVKGGGVGISLDLPRVSEGGGAGAGGGGRARKAAKKATGGRKKKAATVAPATRGPLTDEEFQARADRVDRFLSGALKEYATDKKYAPDGVWDADRDRLHREIAADLYKKADGVPNEGRAVMAGGLGGAGKSTVLKDYAGIDQSQYLTINPDDVKEELVRRGLVPEVPGAGDLSPLEMSPLVHEESSRIAGLVAQMAYNDKKNVIWDITMSSQPSIDSRVSAMRKAGYGDINGVFVDIPTETSVERALSRYRRGVDNYLEGKGNGGRYVPPRIIRAQQTASGRTVNRDSFDNSRDQFDGWSVYDNSVTGRAPQLVDKSAPREAAPKRPGSDGYVPRHIKEVQDFLDGGRAPLPLSYLYGGVSKQSYRDHFTPQDRARVLSELRSISTRMSPEARDRPQVDAAIKALEELLAEGH